MKATLCDMCSAVCEDQDGNAWVKVGFSNDAADDACSFDCALKLLRQMERFDRECKKSVKR